MNELYKNISGKLRSYKRLSEGIKGVNEWDPISTSMIAVLLHLGLPVHENWTR